MGNGAAEALLACLDPRHMNLDGTPYELEPMRPHHVPTVVAIEQRVFSHPWSYASFMHEVSGNPQSEYLVLRYRTYTTSSSRGARGTAVLRKLVRGQEEDCSILGYGGLWLMLDEAHICALAVRSEWRGRGLGELLLAALIERAVMRKATHLTLEVRKSNVVAQNLYLKYGFEQTGVRKGYYLDNREDAIIMSTASIGEEAFRARYARLAESLRERLRHTPPPPEEEPPRHGRRSERRR